MLGRPVALQSTDVRPVEAALIPHELLSGFQQTGKDVPGEVEEGVFGDVLERARGSSTYNA